MAKLPKLPPPDAHYFNAAQGWLELGNLSEAWHELNLISPGRAAHPDVLELRWTLYASEKKWTEALELAEGMVARVPERCNAWIDQSFSLHELGRTVEAHDKLRSVVTKFPKVSTIPYNLACYACQLHRLDEARDWLRKAMRVGGREEITAMALSDADLKLLWAELRARG